jgi:hypothetical protein
MVALLKMTLLIPSLNTTGCSMRLSMRDFPATFIWLGVSLEICGLIESLKPIAPILGWP